MITLLDASNSANKNPIGLYVLHLIKLAGRASSLLIAHLPREKSSPNPSQSERIFNAFRKFEQKNQRHVTLHCYKGISPYASMHNDVCSLALEHRISFIIIPFHKQRIPEHMVDSSHVYRHLNKNVLDKAPCSVGVLIDHGNLWKSKQILVEPSFYRVAVLFFGGADDREALAFSGCMVENSHVRVSLLHFTTPSNAGLTEIVGGTTRSKMLDSEILEEFRLHALQNKNASYQEEEVTDSKDVLNTIESMENAYDLVMVGKRHGDSQLMYELSKWNGHGELGVVGEIVAARKFKLKSSILVVQQQTRVWGLRDPEESTQLRSVKI